MMMTKRQFIALAATIKAHNSSPMSLFLFTADQLDSLASFLQSQNPRFNRQRWLDYIAGNCGPSGGSVKAPKKTFSCQICNLVFITEKGLALHHMQTHVKQPTSCAMAQAATVTAPVVELTHAEKVRAELDAELGDW